MKLYIRLLSIGALFCTPTPASAIDVAKALTKPTDLEFVSSKSIYELERCITLLDLPGVPSVLRQPDRPNSSMMVYTGNKALLIVSLTTEENGTAVEVRFPPASMGGFRKIAECR